MYWEHYLFNPNNLLHCVWSIQTQLDVEAESMRMTQREFLSVEDTVYMPDQDQEPVNRTLIQKAGYLNIRKYVCTVCLLVCLVYVSKMIR